MREESLRWTTWRNQKVEIFQFFWHQIASKKIQRAIGHIDYSTWAKTTQNASIITTSLQPWGPPILICKGCNQSWDGQERRRGELK